MNAHAFARTCSLAPGNRMRTAVETATTLLHVSVFLFSAGLVTLFFFTIHRTVAVIVSISVGIFVVACIVLTILPYTNHNCPYRTPMSNVWVVYVHLSLFSAFFCFRRLFRQLYGRLARSNLGGVVSNTQRILVSGLKIEGAVNKHRIVIGCVSRTALAIHICVGKRSCSRSRMTSVK